MIRAHQNGALPAPLRVWSLPLGREALAPAVMLRSWAEAPWQAKSRSIAMACLPGEVVWLGLSSSPTYPATAVLTSARKRGVRKLSVPPEWQLGWLLDGTGHPAPLSLGDAGAVAYQFDVQQPGLAANAGLDLELLLAPEAWARGANRFALSQQKCRPRYCAIRASCAQGLGRS